MCAHTYKHKSCTCCSSAPLLLLAQELEAELSGARRDRAELEGALHEAQGVARMRSEELLAQVGHVLSLSVCLSVSLSLSLILPHSLFFFFVLSPVISPSLLSLSVSVSRSSICLFLSHSFTLSLHVSLLLSLSQSHTLSCLFLCLLSVSFSACFSCRQPCSLSLTSQQ